MFDPGRRDYYRGRVRTVRSRPENDQLVELLAQMTRADLVRWSDAQLRAAPALAMVGLLYAVFGGPPPEAAA